MPRDLNLTYAARLSVVFAMAMLAAIVSFVIGLGGARFFYLEAAAFETSALLLLALNRGLYRFFWRKHGARFAMCAALVHWLYHLYSGLTWTYCYAGHLVRSFRLFPLTAPANSRMLKLVQPVVVAVPPTAPTGFATAKAVQDARDM
jgi:hypothetical protein